MTKRKFNIDALNDLRELLGVGGDVAEVTATIKGSSQELRGLHANRPDADAVDPGTTYWSVDEESAPGTVFVSDGTNWTVLVVL